MDQRLEATPLLGTEGAKYPFFSPDGYWVSFFDQRELEKVSGGGKAGYYVRNWCLTR